MLDHVATELAATMAMEESVFYPGVIQVTRVEGEHEAPLVSRARSERVVATTDLHAPEFQAKIVSLKKVILHHVREREDELLPKADEVLDERGLAEIGRRMKSLFFRVVEAGYRQSFATSHSATGTLPWAYT